MGFRDLSIDEISHVLQRERVIRIAFAAGDEQFVVPVFYTWHEETLCGLTTPGRKTRLGETNPKVAFQIDSTFATGPWEWASVAGQGKFEKVADPAEFGVFAGELRARLNDAPDWAQELLQQRFATIGMYPWRIRPTELSGRAHGPD
jgi:nitroimidazol reductase NimA-like FMN-containing flavoprotein (pyridoxamine 5'-phosphate oxidase superfamily)